MKIGINSSLINSYSPIRVSPDMLSLQSTLFDLSKLSTTLSARRDIGANVFEVSDPRVFGGPPYYTNAITEDVAFVKDRGSTNGDVSRGQFTFRYRFIAGTNLLQVLSVTEGTEVICDEGSQVDRYTVAWTNKQMNPINPELVVNGVPTGYPAGLKPGQTMRVVHVGGPQDPVGTYTLMGKGTGTIAIQIEYPAARGGQMYTTVSFVNGVPSRPQIVIDRPINGVNMSVWINSSDPANPLHGLRLIMPEPADYKGPSFASLYAANASDPSYFLWHPDFLKVHRPFNLVRMANPSGVNSFTAPVDLKEWDARPPARQRLGFNPSTGVPLEWQTQLSNVLGRDLWYNLPHRVSDDFLHQFGRHLRDSLKADRKAYIEYSNEIWNWSYSVKRWSCMKWANELGKVSIRRAGATATVTKPNHGFASGDTVLISCADQPEYNGEFVITRVDQDTFTYAVQGEPATPATPLADQEILAYKVDALVKTIGDLNFALGPGGVNVSFTLAGSGFVAGDMVLLANCADHKGDGIYQVASVSGSKVSLYYVPCQDRPVPRLVVGDNAMAAKPGAPLRCRMVVSSVSSSAYQNAGIPQSDAAAGRWCGRRHQQVHAILAQYLGDRLGRVMGGFAIDGTHNSVLVDQYKADGGGSFPAGVMLAVGPYFYSSGGTPNDQTEQSLTGTTRACSITSAGGVATVTLSNHGFSTGDRIQISNAAQPEYCGIFPITVESTSRFTYPIVGTPVSPATALPYPSMSGQIRASKNVPWFREITSLTRDGDLVTAVSKGHGFQTGDRVQVSGTEQAEYRVPSVVTRVDADTFTYRVAGQPASPPTMANGPRPWCYDYRVMDPIFEAVRYHISVVLKNRLDEVRNNRCTPNGIQMCCYESGQHLAGVSLQDHPGLTGLFIEANRDPRMGEMYSIYYPMLEAAGNVLANHYMSVDSFNRFGSWGLLEHQNQSELEAPKWRSMMTKMRRLTRVRANGQTYVIESMKNT